MTNLRTSPLQSQPRSRFHRCYFTVVHITCYLHVALQSSGWDEEEFLKYRHVLHYRDLYQQKLAYVRGFLEAVGRLEVWEGRNLGFLTTTVDANQYYDEGSAGRCAAYDPFNRFGDAVLVGANHRYTIQPLEFGRCARACRHDHSHEPSS